MAEDGNPIDEAVASSLREHRPRGPSEHSLERRLAIASILAAAGAGHEVLRLGRLEVEGRIGGGGMGVVYRAYDPRLDRLVAVKLVRGSAPAAERERIADEARALARLTHPNVVAIHDIVNDGQELYFVMELVAGQTLQRWLDANPAATYREIAEWFVQSGRGLAAAHRAGLVHGDVKPENVLVGDDGRARVVDFGLSRRADDVAERGVIAGTLGYMAPEVRAGGPATASSDQFSFCVALSNAVADRPVPDDVRSALSRGMEPDPTARHASMSELLSVLAPAAAGSPSRGRTLLLDRVDRLWLRGVLERSLGEAAPADLALVPAPELVEPPWRSSAVDPGRARVAHMSGLAGLLADAGGALLVVGPPGSGKTTALLTLTRELARRAALDASAPLPVVLSLSSYEPGTASKRGVVDHFGEWVVGELVTKYGLARPAVRRLVDDAELALVLDGLDEADPRQRARLIETLTAFRLAHPLSIVVSCRDSEYESAGVRLAFGAAVRVQPLDDDDVVRIVEARRAPALRARVAREPALRAQLRNPLLLALAAEARGPRDIDAGSGWTSVYDVYVEATLTKLAEPERARLMNGLAFLAERMEATSTSDLWLERLHFGWLPRRADQIAGFAIGVTAVIAFGLGINLAQVPFTGNPLASAITFGLGVSLSSFAYTRGRITPVERLRWSWRRALRLLPITTVCASLVGLAEALRVNFAANIVGAAITGAFLALLFALEPGDRPGQVRPNAGIRRSLVSAVIVSVGFGLPVGLLFGLVINPYVTRPLIVVVEHAHDPAVVVGFAVGLFVFTALFLIYGGFTVIMHAVLRVWLAMRTPLPLDLVGFLDRAADVGLLRRVGGGYVFLHRTLLAYFAANRRGARPLA